MYPIQLRWVSLVIDNNAWMKHSGIAIRATIKKGTLIPRVFVCTFEYIRERVRIIEHPNYNRIVPEISFIQCRATTSPGRREASIFRRSCACSFIVFMIQNVTAFHPFAQLNVAQWLQCFKSATSRWDAGCRRRLSEVCTMQNACESRPQSRTHTHTTAEATRTMVTRLWSPKECAFLRACVVHVCIWWRWWWRTGMMRVDFSEIRMRVCECICCARVG